jgi:hypothetical protein
LIILVQSTTAFLNPKKHWNTTTKLYRCRREVGDRAGVATTLNNIGAVYNSISHPKKHWNTTPSLPIWREVGDRVGGASSW